MKELLFENADIVLESENDIIIGTIKRSFLDYTLACKISKKRLEIFDGKSYPFLTDIKSIKETTKEARDFLASKDGCQNITKGAILIDSAVTKIIANFFIGLSRPVIPSKIFTSEADAKKWLLKKSINKFTPLSK